MKRFVLVAAAAVVVIALVAFAPALAKLDYGRLPTRASWQLPDRVVDALDLETGAQVADLGAGDGYFTFTLADAVGAGGRVYAVDVDADVVDGLQASVTSRGYDNVEAVLGEYDDPGLPDERSTWSSFAMSTITSMIVRRTSPIFDETLLPARALRSLISAVPRPCAGYPHRAIRPTSTRSSMKWLLLDTTSRRASISYRCKTSSFSSRASSNRSPKLDQI